MRAFTSLQIALALSLLIVAVAGSAPNASTTLIVTEVYGGGGNAGAPYNADFLEIRNVGGSPASLNGYSLQYAASTGTSWSKTDLPNASLGPGQYFLVQMSTVGANGSALPTPDHTAAPAIAMAATAGKVALVSDTTALTGACPSGSSIVDLVGYGSGASCFEGSSPAPAPSNTTSDQRVGGDTDRNALDFTEGAPAPRNTQSPTAVRLLSFSAVRDGRQVVLRWRTASETGTLGYVLYRLTGTHARPLGSRLIRTSGGTRGGAYVRRGRLVPGAAYRLVAVSLAGVRTPLAVARSD